ncbi:MAG: RloB family protein [Cyanobacteriota bacterium]|nr:RloB family protein [Cyanobacteriota bacterium]
MIVCEGKETEPNYFRSFRVPKDVIDVRGLGEEPRKLLKEAIKIRDKEDNNDLVWCVLDN